MATQPIVLPDRQIVALVAATLVRQPGGNLPNEVQIQRAVETAHKLVAAAHAETKGA